MKLKQISIIIIILIIITIFLYLENNLIQIENIDFYSNKLPHGFNEYTIVQISDLHGKKFGKNQSTLISKIQNISPDIIVITGDLIDSYNYNDKWSLKLVQELKKIASIYFVAGNHEYYSDKYDGLSKKLKAQGVKILSNSNLKIKKNGGEILIAGVDDPSFSYGKGDYDDKEIIKKELERAFNNSENQEFKILLSHRPELFPIYTNYNPDLIFSGHAHGGQIRLPFIGGLIAPNQGFFPKYTSGLYRMKNSSMIVSRGLGSSSFPQRLFNRPEIIVTTLMIK